MIASKRIHSNLNLIDFLKNTSSLARFRPPTTTPPPVYVLGNPSSDLDSIISAIVYSYFASLGRKRNQNARQYIPLINLPDVKSGAELRRLRPEFITALGLATELPSDNKSLDENVLTVADLRDGLNGSEHDVSDIRNIDVFMVDWNALPVTASGRRGVDGISETFEDIRISVLGCIDHHEDEHFVPELNSLGRSEEGGGGGGGDGGEVEPRVIQPGVGSCTSLVVRELRARNLWISKQDALGYPAMNTGASVPSRDNDSSQNPASPSTPTSSRPENTTDDHVQRAISQSQVAKLALAAILADTANMTAESKVSDVDREAVSFLEDKITHATNLAHANNNIPPSGREWDRQSFYNQTMQAKSSSVENLTIDEVLGRDYKEWVDHVRRDSDAGNKNEHGDGGKVKIGICNVVKPLSWVIGKAAKVEITAEIKINDDDDDDDALFTSLGQFARARELDVVALMTVYTTEPDNEFHRELVVWVLNDAHLEGFRRFEAGAVRQFDLIPWVDEEKGRGVEVEASGNRKAWIQKDVTKSRKQVAPLLRGAMTGGL